MKVFDKTTQTYKEVRIKPGGDTLPIGTIVEYNGTTVPEGWEEVESNTKVLWTGNSKGGNIINLDVSSYKRLKIKVKLSAFITFLEIDLSIQTSGITKDGIIYKYGNSITCGALDGVNYINKCSVAVSENKKKIIGYDFGFADISATTWKFNNRDNSEGWEIREIIGIKN